MPTAGGTADKLGNRYEALWAVDQLLRIVGREAASLTAESLDSDESRGVEFRVDNANGTVDYWSVKRQTTRAAGWTLALLADEDDRGRTILGDLLAHVDRDPANRAVFASALGAYQLDELRAYAVSRPELDTRLALDKKLSAAFAERLVPLCGGDRERARAFLLRVRTLAADEAQLRNRVEFAIRTQLYATAGTPALDPAAVRRLLADLVLDRLHRPTDRRAIIDALATIGVGVRDWALDHPVRERVAVIREGYTGPVRRHRIGGGTLPLPNADSVVGRDGRPARRRTLVCGVAGGGKSTALADAVDRMAAAGVPVMPVRFDELPDGLASPADLGRRRFDLPDSPVAVLAGLADGGPGVLLLDQLDSVSTASGRRSERWSLVEDLLREAGRFPNLSVIVGCREFDLEHDRRIRALKVGPDPFYIVSLGPLSLGQVDAAVAAAGGPLAHPSVRLLLTVPLHLGLFLDLPPAARGGVRTRDDLFGQFWQEKRLSAEQRLGRPPDWAGVVGRLTAWLSDQQQLSAPAYVFDAVQPGDVAALASEGVLERSGDRYRFFHEAFFDYAFARRLVAEGGRLTDLLLGGEQHLFRRAQVRQVLAFLREAGGRGRYLAELRAVLLDGRVRFHVRRSALAWLSALPDPAEDEWDVLRQLLDSDPLLRTLVVGTVAGNAGWFDVLLRVGFLDAALVGPDQGRQLEAVHLMTLTPVPESRPDQVAALARRHWRAGDGWQRYLWHVSRAGRFYHSRGLFDVFLALVDDGLADGRRPGGGRGGDWWEVLYPMADKRPGLACEAIGRWFDRAAAALTAALPAASALDPSGPFGFGEAAGRVIAAASGGAPAVYVAHLLPRVAALVDRTAGEDEDRLRTDPLFAFRTYGEVGRHSRVAAALLSALARSAETLAKWAPDRLDAAVAPYLARADDALAYVLLRGWTAAPETYADTLADYLAADPRRLKVGYGCCGADGGSAVVHTSTGAVRAASRHCSADRLSALEAAVLSSTDWWEARHPQQRGRTQLALLDAFDRGRLGPPGVARLAELRAKFPAADDAGPPRPVAMVGVGPPIPHGSLAKMSDADWVRAMGRYTDGTAGSSRPPVPPHASGARELANALEDATAADPARFCGLAVRLMPDALPPVYFEGVLRGLVGQSERIGPVPPPPSTGLVTALVRKVHALPGRPCGRAVTWLVSRWPDASWPEDVVAALVWYATEDPDPAPTTDGDERRSRDPFHAGLNSVRGSAAVAAAHLLQRNPVVAPLLTPALERLARDHSVAVRACAVAALLALLPRDPGRAIALFAACVGGHPTLLVTPRAPRFTERAARSDYGAVRPVLIAMLHSTDETVAAEASGQLCLLALSEGAAEPDAGAARAGGVAARRGAAEAYAAHVAGDVFGGRCRTLVKPFFADVDGSVREAAASAFRRLPDMSTADQADLLTAFLDADPPAAALGVAVQWVEHARVALPDVVCRLLEAVIRAGRDGPGGHSHADPGVAIGLSKVAVRLYAQSDDAAVQGRCLTAIDEMERNNFLGLGEELRLLDR